MRLAGGIVFAGFVVAVLALWLTGAGTGIARWAAAEQRAFQDVIAAAVTRLRQGDAAALWALVGACGAYGVVHAIGPGHGKVLIGGAGIGSAVTARRLVGLAFVSSLAQAGTAILLVYGGFAIFEMTAARAVGAVDDLLAPASAAAIAAIGLWLVARGVRGLLAVAEPRPVAGGADHDHPPGLAAQDPHHHHAEDACGCGHSHAPTASQVEAMRGWRDAVAVVGGIAIRPCTGAVIVLVLAWRFGVPWAGAAAVVAMALGTAAVVMAVAAASVGARRSALVASGGGGRTARLAAPALQIAGGGFIAATSALLLAASLG